MRDLRKTSNFGPNKQRRSQGEAEDIKKKDRQAPKRKVCPAKFDSARHANGEFILLSVEELNPRAGREVLLPVPGRLNFPLLRGLVHEGVQPVALGRRGDGCVAKRERKGWERLRFSRQMKRS